MMKKKIWVIATAVLAVLTISTIALLVHSANAIDVMKPAPEQTGLQNHCVGFDSTKGITIIGTHQNKVIAYGSDSRKIWEFSTSAAVCQIKVNSQTRKLYAGDSSGVVSILNLDNGSKIGAADCSTRLYGFDVTKDGSKIVISAGPSTMKHYLFFYDDRGNQISVSNVGITAQSVVYASDEKSVFIGNNRSDLMQYGTDGKLIKKVSLGYGVINIKNIAEKKEIVVTTKDAGYHVFTEELVPVKNSSATGTTMALGTSSDGSYTAIGTQEGYIYIFNQDGKQIYSKKAPYSVTDILFNSQKILITGFGNFLYQIDLNALKTLEMSNKLNSLLKVLVVIFPILLLIGAIKSVSAIENWVRKVLHALVKYRTAYLLLIPTFILLIVFNYYPVIIAFLRSFTDWSKNTSSISEINFVGFDNFKTMITEGYFLIGIKNLLIMIGTSFIKVLTMPLLVAEIVFAMRSNRSKYWFRFLFVLPMVVPGVVNALMWGNIYDPSIGLLNRLFSALNLASWQRVWLGDPSTAIWAIVFVGFPFIDAFAFLIYYGALINIPSSLFEAAKVDGSNFFYDFCKIHMPLIVPQLKLLITLTFINSVQDFTNIYLLTGGGPGSSTYVPGLELYYNATKFGRYGYACALGVVIFVVIFAGTLINMKIKTTGVSDT